MSKRRLTEERLEELRYYIGKVGIMEDILDLIHDLELADAEVERLRNFLEGKKMLRTCCPNCGDIINFVQAALEEEKPPTDSPQD